MRNRTWSTWQRTALAGALCGALSLGLTACGDDPAPEPDDQAEPDEIADDVETPDAKPVMVYGEGAVRPNVPPPTGSSPPKHWRAVGPSKKPLGPDTGAKAALPTGPIDPATARVQMDKHFEVAHQPAPRFNPAGRAVDDPSRLQDLKKFRKVDDAMKSALTLLVNVGSRYIETVTEEKAEPVPRFQYGFALATLADKSPGSRAQEMRMDAIHQFKSYLAGPEEKARFVADAEYLLGTTLLKVGDAYGPTIDEALDHLEKGAALMRGAGRAEEAGVATYNVLATLIERAREKDASEAAVRLQADEFDFGARTKTVRRLVRRASLHPGAVMPDFEGVVDADGKALSLAARRGAPVLIHLFQAGGATGRVTAARDIETVLVPLARTYAPQGLQMIGGSMDLALTDEQVDKIRTNWEEWGKKGAVHDGSLKAVRSWCASAGMDWTLHHDGKWFAGALAEHLGVISPYSFLLDAEGVIRWRGKAPYKGLEDAVKAVIVR